MTTFTHSIEIAAPADQVWSIMRDIEHWPEWTPTVIRLVRLDAGPLAVGSRARIWQPKLLPAVWQVTSLDGRGFEWMTRSPGVRVTGRHHVEPAAAGAAGGSRAVLSLHFAGPLGALVARFTRSLNLRYLALEAEGLKRRSEAGGGARRA